MAARKTFEVADLLEKINHRNMTSTCSSEVRDGWNSIMEEVLMRTNNYAGFSYLTAKEVPNGMLPGIAQEVDGTNMFPDETRKMFYVASNLKADYNSFSEARTKAGGFR